MKLSEMRKQVNLLCHKANEDYKGKLFKIPTSILEKSNSSYVSMCEVLKVNLQENLIELLYEAEGDVELWTVISIDDFEKNAVVTQSNG